MSAATPRDLAGPGTAVLACVFIVTIVSPARAQDGLLPFLGGGAIALAMHESGHVVLDVAFDASPGVARVSFGPIPFFAITHEVLPPGREFAVSSAGFWVQHVVDEIILTRVPHLRARRAPLTKGIVAFNVLASVAYAGAAFARVGPAERDTRGIAVSANIAEPWVGVLVLSPALLDAGRYVRPNARWLAWASRAAKVTQALFVFRAAE